MMRFLMTIGCCSALLLTSCSQSSNQTQPHVNQAPVFSSPSTLSTNENSSATIYTATASDNDGGAVSYSLGTDGDSALFVINANSGALNFITPPDFEAPIDSDANNDYSVTIIAQDGQGGQTSLALTVTVTNVDQSFQINRVGTGFTQPLYLSSLPDGTGRVLVLEKRGRIRILDPETGLTDSVDFMDISTDVDSASEGGLLGLEFAPDYNTSGEFYLNVTNRVNGAFRTEIRRYTTVSGRLDIGDPMTKDIILTIDQPFGNHNAGWIGFDSSDNLIIPMGDGGSSGDPMQFAQNTQSLLGKVLRIDVGSDAFPNDDEKDYAIPAGNSFTVAADGLPEIYAVGLRNPFRSSFDPFTGNLLIADVGQNAAEEVSMLPMNDASLNFGWNIKEGTLDYENNSTTVNLTPPVLEYFHGNSEREGRSITGGYVYTGPVEALQGQYIFADFINDNIWSVPAAELAANGNTIPSAQFSILNTEFTPDIGALTRISSFGLDAQRNLYIVTIGGDVFRMNATN